MTLMYGQGGGSGNPLTMPPTEYRLGGVRALKLMLGTGATAVEVWSGRYARTASAGPATVSTGTWTDVLTHTVADSGGYSVITASGYWGHIYSNTTHDLAILLNGTQIASASTPSDRASKFHAVTATERLLAPGDTITISVRSSSTTTEGRTFTPSLSSA